jgi:two-component system, NarL family, response regulator LiaR
MATVLSQPGTKRGRQDPIRVAVTADHALFRYGLREVLTEYGFSVVGEAGTAERGLEVVLRTAPHLVMVDLDMPGASGMELVRRLSMEAPLTRAIVLVSRADEEVVLDAVAAGACGLLLKDAPPEDIHAALRAAFAGASPVSPQIATILLERLRASQKDAAAARSTVDLSERELQVLRLVAQGKDNQEIATELFLSPSTVKSHVSRILTKLHVRNRIQAAVYTAKQGLL